MLYTGMLGRGSRNTGRPAQGLRNRKLSLLHLDRPSRQQHEPTRTSTQRSPAAPMLENGHNAETAILLRPQIRLFCSLPGPT